MNKYIKPEIDIVKFEVHDIVTASGETPSELSVWGSKLGEVDSAATTITDLL